MCGTTTPACLVSCDTAVACSRFNIHTKRRSNLYTTVIGLYRQQMSFYKRIFHENSASDTFLKLLRAGSVRRANTQDFRLDGSSQSQDTPVGGVLLYWTCLSATAVPVASSSSRCGGRARYWKGAWPMIGNVTAAVPMRVGHLKAHSTLS